MGRGVAVCSSPNLCHHYTDIISIISSWEITGVKGKKQHGKSPDPHSVVFRGPEIETHSQLLTKVNIYGTGNHFKCTLFMQRLVMSTSCLNRECIQWDNFNKKAHRKPDISPRKWSMFLSVSHSCSHGISQYFPPLQFMIRNILQLEVTKNGMRCFRLWF